MIANFLDFADPILSLAVWQYVFLGNTVGRYALALAVFVGLLIVFQIVQVAVIGRLKKLADRTKTELDDTLIAIVKSIKPPFYSFVAFYLALQFLIINPFLLRIIEIILIGWVLYQAIRGAQILIDYLFKKKIGQEKEMLTKSAAETMSKIAKGILWAFGILLLLSNLGVNVSSLLAGLGIGGIAVALALQNILSDLFSSFSIYFDKPFVVGDFIVVGDKKGVVKKIGIKTTRIQSLQGEEIIISNRELTTATVQNFKRMQERRASFTFGVLYKTPQEKLKKIPDMVREIIESMEMTRFDRAHFKAFGDSSLDFEVVYYVKTPDYGKYMDINQEIHLAINERFAKENISMAYPTRTVYLHKD